jgi:hypothetical protein
MDTPIASIRELMSDVTVTDRLLYPFSVTPTVPLVFRAPLFAGNGNAEDSNGQPPARLTVNDALTRVIESPAIDHTLAAATLTFPRHGLFMSSPSPTPSDGPGYSTGLPLPAAHQDEPSPLLSPLTTPAALHWRDRELRDSRGMGYGSHTRDRSRSAERARPFVSLPPPAARVRPPRVTLESCSDDSTDEDEAQSAASPMSPLAFDRPLDTAFRNVTNLLVPPNPVPSPPASPPSHPLAPTSPSTRLVLPISQPPPTPLPPQADAPLWPRPGMRHRDRRWDRLRCDSPPRRSRRPHRPRRNWSTLFGNDWDLNWTDSEVSVDEFSEDPDQPFCELPSSPRRRRS